jgi:uncharacterized protein
MPTLNLDENDALYQIRAFRPGLIQVNEKTYTRSLIISPSQLIENWAPQTVTELSADSLAIITDLKPDILLIGTGSKLIFLPIDTYGELINQGIGVEVMDSSAACRTYNALSAENRRVVAALIIK